MSPQTGDAALAAPTRAAGGRGGSPGDATTSSGANVDELRRARRRADAARRRAPITGEQLARLVVGRLGDDTSTSAPSSASVSATAKPVTAEAEHGDAEARPVGVPAGQGVEAVDGAVMSALSHSR